MNGRREALERDRTVPVGEAAQHPAPARLRTLLGSCVAVTVWHPHLRIGGLCHVVNARRRDSAAVRVWGTAKPPAWFADEAVPRLLGWAAALDSATSRWEVKVFGGGRQFSGAGFGARRMLDVPADNLDEVRAQLAEAGTAPVAWHVGGTGSRLVVLDVATGGVWLKHRPRDGVDDTGLPLRVRQGRAVHGADVAAADVLARLDDGPGPRTARVPA